MEIRVLKYFIEVARSGSFTRAAEVLHITQPSLSKQMKLLEDQANLVAANLGQALVVLLGDVLAVKQDLAGGGTVHAADDVHQRGLAGAGGAHDGHPLPVVHLHAHIVQRVKATVDFGYIFQFKQAHVYPPYSPFNTRAGSISVALRMGIRQASPVTRTETMIVTGRSQSWKVMELENTCTLTN